MRPALKSGLLPVWRDRDTLQIGIDPRRAMALSGMSRAAVLIALLDGSRDREQLLAAAARHGIAEPVAERILTLLAAGGALDDFPASTLREIPAPLRTRLAAELATASLAHGDGDGGARFLARRRASTVWIEGDRRIGRSIVRILTAAGVGQVRIRNGRADAPDTVVRPATDRPAPARPAPARPLGPRGPAPHASANSGAQVQRSPADPAGLMRRAALQVADRPGADADARRRAAARRPARARFVTPMESTGPPAPPGPQVPPRALRPPTPPTPPRPPDLVILVGQPSMDRSLALVRNRTPHLAAAASEAIGVVGPLVVPGRTACLRCLDYVRAASDPAWPLILAQLAARRPEPAACDAVLATAVAAQAAAQALLAIDKGPAASAAANGTLELVLPDWRWRRRTWPRHPACLCASHAAR